MGQRFGYRGADITVTFENELPPGELLDALVEAATFHALLSEAVALDRSG